MTAPMDTVINDKNYKIFKENGIMPVLPRIANPEKYYVDTEIFLSYSLDDFERIFLHNTAYIPKNKKAHVLIDIANGHMNRLYDMARIGKEKYGDSLFLMVGNIANPDTFFRYASINVDAIRIGIGNGNGCLTTVQTGVGYPMASLIEKCRNVKELTKKQTLIVADGGFKKYADIIKALGLGADYVMLGSILNKALESAGETTIASDTLGNHKVIDQYGDDAKKMFDAEIHIYKTFRGMSTKEVQKSWGKENLTTSEGVVRRNRVEYTLDGWVKNFESYLRSAMSYTGKEKLHQFIGGVNFNHITTNAFKRFDK
jgi:IMP dehydrogenase/GMP reductase